MTTTPTGPGAGPGARLTRVEHTWRAFTRLAAVLRNTALGNLGFVLVAIVAGAGWYLSYHNLHGYAVEAMGFSPGNAWLVPVVFDGAPLGLSIVVYRARLQARAALVWRAGIWAFAALSAWVNWLHVPSVDHADALAALLPLASVVLFEGLMAETHKAAQADLHGGAVVPRLTLACWVLDGRRTFHAFRVKALRPLAAAETALGIACADPAEPRSVLAVPVQLAKLDLASIGRALSRPHDTADASAVGGAVRSAVETAHDASVRRRAGERSDRPADSRSDGDHDRRLSRRDVRSDRTAGAAVENTPQSHRGTRSGSRSPQRSTGRAAGRSRRSAGRAEPDVSDLIDLGQQVYRDLWESGETVTRDRLRTAIRERGHAISTDRAGALLRRLRNGHAPALN